MSGEGVQECRAPGRRTSSLHMDVRFLAVPEHLYPAANATYEAQIPQQLTNRRQKKGASGAPFS
tara:strand:+ start:912 stop:1103 length:192 start_codon:yes stop_codon:yes gene_type:complete